MLDVRIQSKGFVSSEGQRIDVLKDVEFRCESRSFTCVVGPSGCGKTTTLRCILGLDQEFEGAIDVVDNTGNQKVSAVFQEPRLLPWRTVDQNVKLALKQIDDEFLGALFEELGLSAHRDFYPTELSLGLARRASLARAFAVQPSVLILDEPFVSLDEDTATRLRSLLLKVWSERSCTALMVTHNINEAIEIADRILFFGGAPAGIVNDYKIAVPRAERDEQTVLSIRSELKDILGKTDSSVAG